MIVISDDVISDVIDRRYVPNQYYFEIYLIIVNN